MWVTGSSRGGEDESRLNGDLVKDVPAQGAHTQDTGGPQDPRDNGRTDPDAPFPRYLSLSLSLHSSHICSLIPIHPCHVFWERVLEGGGGNMATRARDGGPRFFFSMRSSLLFWDLTLTLALAGAWDASIAWGFIPEGGAGRVRPLNAHELRCSRPPTCRTRRRTRTGSLV